MSEHNPIVKRLAFWGIPLSFGVLGLKLLAWWVTGSVALLSDGLESTVNVVAAFIAYFVIGYAQKPADHDHPYGHHKAEYISAVIEGVLIVIAALLIMKEAVAALEAPTMLDAPALGLAINFAAGVVNAVWATILIRVGKANRSPALTADGQHIMSDVVTSVGVLIGLVLVVITGYAILDPLLAILVACNIIYQGWKVISHSVDGLMDKAVEPAEEDAIKKAIADHASGSLGVHYLRTRRAGAATFVGFDLVVPAVMPVGEAHEICDRLEAAVQAVQPGARVTIHVEPESEEAHGVRVKVIEGEHA
ncbi:cation transporter [Agrobacterium vitis]|uniref:Cation diffusion facilitator family transporter n=1 Tax=Agrobacterium vitis TaxID=373 RepID=A0AAE5AUP2_AGRVI|nr:cation diffusion facilitator family transporter [Agrobacterium vitis]MCF1498461.1 cation transporter [Allorhizobium sp. Av2]MCM2438421.1 cation transporter [Agrobacterium vitis]MUZ56197.1 cation diffusion facilitator family transporter [Agrobacterium vitis]MVA64666.1 cation diffusion facilitator family transporter [Agrobacterium vitis]MVA85637.1 cation diffusion facilitator family transporter [Agrobacterium vitis]